MTTNLQLVRGDSSPQSPANNVPNPTATLAMTKLNLISHDALSMNTCKSSRLHCTSSSAPPPSSSQKKHASVSRKKHRNASLSPAPAPPSSHGEQAEEKQSHSMPHAMQNKSTAVCVYDLTAVDTPITTSSDSDDSDIAVIDTVIRTRTRTHTAPWSGHDHQDAHSPRVETAPDPFEEYTVNGIGGQLLRKAGWDGDTRSLAPGKNRAVQASEKYASSQKRTIRRHNGVGFNTSTGTAPQHRTPRLRPRQQQQSFHAPPAPSQTPAHRRLQVAFPTSSNVQLARMVSAAHTQAHVHRASNTRQTAIVLTDSDSDSDSDSESSENMNMNVHENESKTQPTCTTKSTSTSINTIDVLLGTNTASTTTTTAKQRGHKRHRHSSQPQQHPQAQKQKQAQQPQRKRPKMAEHVHCDGDGNDDSDCEVMLMDKREVARTRIRETPFAQIIGKLKVFTEQMTLAEIRGAFTDDDGNNSNRKRINHNIPSVTRIVISMKDQYSQCRIATPVRGQFCHHLQPFDAKTFLLRPRKYQKCDTCNRRIAKHELVKCAYFERIFTEMRRSYDEQIEQIEIMQDGSYKAVIPKHLRDKPAAVKRPEQRVNETKTTTTTTREVVGIDDDEVHEERKEKTQPAAPKIIVLSSSEDEDDNDTTYVARHGHKPTAVVDLVDDDDSECYET